jgi:putative ABC transport system permease protein
VGADWWLGRFAYRIGLSVWPFLAAGLGALVVAVLAVSTQALRAARVDPAQVLRSE